MEVVDLTDSDQEGPTPKRQATEDGQPGAEGDFTAANDGPSRESTVEVTDTCDSDLPTLEELFLQAKARRMGVSGAHQRPTEPEQLLNGTGNIAGDDSHVCGPYGSQDAPIVLEDDGSDTELDDATSDDDGDDDRTHTANLPPDANDHWSSSSSSEIVGGPAQDTPHSEAPAATGRIHDVFAEYEGKFGVDSLTRKSGAPKGRGSSSPRRTNPVRDGRHSPQMGDQQCRERTRSSPTAPNSTSPIAPNLTSPTAPNPSPSIAPNLPSRKRSGPPTGSHAPPFKRSCGFSRVAARRARESKESSTRSDSHKKERLRHAFPRHCRDKDWDVVDLRISMEEDGSLKCELLWAPTTVSVSTLKGELLERAEELVRRDHGAETWDKWLEMQGKTGRRCRSRWNPRGGK